MRSSDVGLEAAFRSEAGPRPSNEDSVLCAHLPDGAWLVAVADGMGGLEAGEAASRTAIETLEAEVRAGLALSTAVHTANTAVHERAGGRAMGTTLVAALARGGSVRVANVGDSRAFHVGALGLQQITRDHTLRGEAAEQGRRAERDAAASRWGGSLTRSLGGGAEVEVDVFDVIPIGEGESILLCSDGVHGVVTADEIETILLSSEDARAAVDRLVERALDSGTEDNVSAVVLRRPARRRASTGASDLDVESAPQDSARPAASASRSARAEWDPARLVKLSGRHLRRKSRVPRGAFVVGALAVLVVVLALLLR